MKKKIVSIVLILVMLQTYMVSIIAATTSDLNNQKSEIQDKINDVKDEQKEVKQELDAEMKVISQLDAEIDQAQGEIDKLNAQINEVQASITEKENLIQEKQKEYDSNEELLKQRIVIMYEIGETTFLDILFNSKSIVDFISNYYTVSQIVKYDTDLLQTIEDDKNIIENAKKELEEKKSEIETLKNDKVSKQNAIKAKRASRQEKANKLNTEQKALQAKIDDYNAQIKKVEQQMAAIAEEANGKINGSGLKFDGSFIWPCNNKIVTSTVKIRWGRWHKGIDIGARYENVYAAASGYAYIRENPGGYGHYIMIFHGSGYVTLYGHLNAYKITSGQYVSQGQVIAQSGNTGASQGAHLHFEVRKASSISDYFSSNFLNPLDYLPGGYTLAAGAATPS